MPQQPTDFKPHTDDTMKAIIEKNPLYKFREAQDPKWSMRTAGLYIGVTQQAVANWESGSHYPTDENLRSMARVMNTTFEKLSIAWAAWDKRKASTLQSV